MPLAVATAVGDNGWGKWRESKLHPLAEEAKSREIRQQEQPARICLYPAALHRHMCGICCWQHIHEGRAGSAFRDQLIYVMGNGSPASSFTRWFFYWAAVPQVDRDGARGQEPGDIH